MDERPQVRTVDDTRRPAYGLGRILVAVFAVVGLVILVPAVVVLVREPYAAPVMESFNLLGGVLYILLAVCVAHNGRRMRNIGWMSLAALATMAVLIGALTLSAPMSGLERSVWAEGGVRLWYLPAVLPVVAAVWMWLSDPRRIVINAERITEFSDSLADSLERTRASLPGVQASDEGEDAPSSGRDGAAVPEQDGAAR